MDPIYVKYKVLIWFMIFSGLLLVVFHYWSEKRKRDKDLYPLNEDTDRVVKPDLERITGDDDLLFREVCHGLKADMLNASSKAEIEAYYWEIEHLEDDYRGKVSDILMKMYLSWLYQIQAQERDRIAGQNAPKFALG